MKRNNDAKRLPKDAENGISDGDAAQIAAAFAVLADWVSGRELVFRDERTPYRVLVAEFMLQQTQAKTMLPYYQRFLSAWPTVQALAAASKEDVLAAFAGLGYYRRAGYLHETANRIVRVHGSRVPADPDTLLSLPGIGRYTANAIASIAFGKRVAAVDGNVVRVLARLLRKPFRRSNQQDLNAVRTIAEDAFALLGDTVHAGDINEALMDLSATICKPTSPLCSTCPVRAHCLAFAHGDQEKYPLKPPAKEKPVTTVSYLLLEQHNGFYVRRRRESLLKDTYEFVRLASIEDAPELPAIALSIGKVTHVFSHRVWKAEFFYARLPDTFVQENDGVLRIGSLDYHLVGKEQMKQLPFASLFKTALEYARQTKTQNMTPAANEH